MGRRSCASHAAFSDGSGSPSRRSATHAQCVSKTQRPSFSFRHAHTFSAFRARKSSFSGTNASSTYRPRSMGARRAQTGAKTPCRAGSASVGCIRPRSSLGAHAARPRGSSGTTTRKRQLTRVLCKRVPWHHGGARSAVQCASSGSVTQRHRRIQASVCTSL